MILGFGCTLSWSISDVALEEDVFTKFKDSKWYQGKRKKQLERISSTQDHEDDDDDKSLGISRDIYANMHQKKLGAQRPTFLAKKMIIHEDFI